MQHACCFSAKMLENVLFLLNPSKDCGTGRQLKVGKKLKHSQQGRIQSSHHSPALVAMTIVSTVIWGSETSSSIVVRVDQCSFFTNRTSGIEVW